VAYIGDFNTKFLVSVCQTLAVHLLAIEFPLRILGITRILERDKSKAWGLASDPDVPDPTKLAECVIDVALVDIAVQVTDVQLNRQGVMEICPPAAMMARACHARARIA